MVVGTVAGVSEREEVLAVVVEKVDPLLPPVGVLLPVEDM